MGDYTVWWLHCLVSTAVGENPENSMQQTSKKSFKKQNELTFVKGNENQRSYVAFVSMTLLWGWSRFVVHL